MATAAAAAAPNKGQEQGKPQKGVQLPSKPLPLSQTERSSQTPMACSFDATKLWGWLLVSIGSIFFVGYFFLALISKLLPPSNIPLISSFQNDWYYCFLVPLTLPIIVVAVYFHWLSMKMFKHA
ncbi:uncharacterized protein [Cicer arietinum]|uniref:Uncharacterized protein LOC101488616 isoform X2 n=1 Tax=Cicer arietinum TaxID=3827 RepID=A0A1S2Z5C1_CICAR|nr:uncharacterized protein LOC101488616 isoform X2 [Cicer arietinum]